MGETLFTVQNVWSSVLYTMLQQTGNVEDAILAADKAVEAFKKVTI